MSVEDPEDELWRSLTTDDLIEVNRYARNKILEHKVGRFFPIQGRWFDTYGPGISDGRYVLFYTVYDEKTLKHYSRS